MITIFTLSACAEMPQLFWSVDDDTPAYARGAVSSSKAESRVPLDVPPSLRGEIEVSAPEADETQSGEVAKEVVAGKAVALDAKLYTEDASTVFSAVVDAMTAMDMPVQSVDSPSGTVTTDWVRQEALDAGATAALTNMFGFGGGVQALRYRFVVRVLRQSIEEEVQTRLEIRTVGQAFINRHWVSRPIHRKVSGKLFAAVDERLSN